MKKVFTPTKKRRISTPSDCSDNEVAEKEDYIYKVFISASC